MRPRTRADCIDGPRPCPWSCRFNLLFDTLPDGSISIRSGDRRIIIPRTATAEEFEATVDAATSTWTNLPSCALDEVGDTKSLAEVALRLGVTRQAVHLIEGPAQTKLRQALVEAGVELNPA